ncbi:MAG: hypothetical protein JWL72_484 [Ilumatobacteraceae bacterium]|nr:hypothetical protein [Ilumatobacteraceae bacterium]
MIGICTDSNSQLPSELAERFGVEVVPLTVAIDDREYLEGVDLSVDDFYELYRDGHRPAVRCNQPSPGQFAGAYDDLVARGCTEILSIHTGAQAGSTCSSTLRAARLGAHSVPVPVRIVDSGTARFQISCCVWAAGAAIAGGASIDEAAAIAEGLSPLIGTVFMASGPGVVEMCRSGARRVHALEANEFRLVREADDLSDAISSMAGYALHWNPAHRRDGCGLRLNVGIGWAHADTEPIARAIAHSVGESAHVAEVITFRIGPSVGAETGPDAVSCVVFPAQS